MRRSTTTKTPKAQRTHLNIVAKDFPMAFGSILAKNTESTMHSPECCCEGFSYGVWLHPSQELGLVMLIEEINNKNTERTMNSPECCCEGFSYGVWLHPSQEQSQLSY
jgi:hypothetical protein